MTKSIGVAAIATAALATLPASAPAATLTFGAPCAVSGDAVPVSGTGFAPGKGVQLRGEGVSGFATADAAGAFAGSVTGFTSARTVQKVPVTATQDGVAVTSATLSLIREAFLVDANLNGSPRSVVRWRFAGFPSGRSVYGHFRLRGKTYRNYRFGRATGPCGTLTARARRLPVSRLRYGTWRLKFDASRRYSSSAPGRLGTLTVFRTFR